MSSSTSPLNCEIDADVEKWKARYPNVSSIIPSVTELVSQLRKTPSLEMEARFGFFKTSKFVPGVDREEVDRLMEMMQKSTHLSCSGDWVEEQDFFYNSKNGSQCRTRVSYDDRTMNVLPTTIQKKTMGNVDIGITDAKGQTVHEGIRVSLKEEKPHGEENACVETNLVRLKQKRKFKSSCSVWSYDFSMIWSGKTKTEAELSQSQNDPLFEVECEIIEPHKILAMQSDAKIATSLLLKMGDLVKISNFVFYLL